MNVIFCHAYLMEAMTQVQFGEPRGSTKLVKELVNGGHGELVFNGDGIEKGLWLSLIRPKSSIV